jgi:hypothetical protein
MLMKKLGVLGFCVSLAATVQPSLTAVQANLAHAHANVANMNEWSHDNSELLALIGTAMHVPAIMTMDSDRVEVAHVAAILAALPTQSKIWSKFFSKMDTRFFAALGWDVPRFLAYLGTTPYDVINVLYPKYAQTVRAAKGDKVRVLKREQLSLVAVELLCRVIALAARLNASDRNSSVVAALAHGLGDVVELHRLIRRYALTGPVPGVNFALELNVHPVDEDGNDVELFEGVQAAVDQALAEAEEPVAGDEEVAASEDSLENNTTVVSAA